MTIKLLNSNIPKIILVFEMQANQQTTIMATFEYGLPLIKFQVFLFQYVELLHMRVLCACGFTD